MKKVPEEQVGDGSLLPVKGIREEINREAEGAVQASIRAKVVDPSGTTLREISRLVFRTTKTNLMKEIVLQWG